LKINILKAKVEDRKKRVCAYARVSTGSSDQMNSLENQIQYWDSKFLNDKTVEYLGVYYDKAISGVKTNRRKAFLQLIKMAKQGLIDTIYTKSFSRFSRNSIDSIEALRVFEEYGVNVIFEKECIDSADPKKKFLINVLAKVSEDNSASTSNNLKIVIRSKIKEGKIVSGRCYGYYAVYNTQRKEYEYSVNEKEAEIVKLIFTLYSQGLGTEKISRLLYEKEIKSSNGNTRWSSSSIIYLLKNEKYLGNVRLQKYYSHNFEKVKNRNDYIEAPQVLVENTHEPIIDKKLFDKVQEILKLRIKPFVPNEDRAFTGKLICGGCGKKFIHKVHYYNGEKKYDYWQCGGKIKDRLITKCAAIAIKDNLLYDLFKESYKECLEYTSQLGDLANLEKKRKVLIETEENLNKMIARGYINKEKFSQESEKIVIQIEDITKQITEEKKKEKSVLPLSENEPFDSAVRKYLEKVTVKDLTVTFHFINGFKTIRRYENGTVGAQKGNNNPRKNKKRAV
jgi:site-specific DNA recombinase